MGDGTGHDILEMSPTDTVLGEGTMGRLHTKVKSFWDKQ